MGQEVDGSKKTFEFDLFTVVTALIFTIYDLWFLTNISEGNSLDILFKDIEAS